VLVFGKLVGPISIRFLSAKLSIAYYYALRVVPLLAPNPLVLFTFYVIILIPLVPLGLDCALFPEMMLPLDGPECNLCYYSSNSLNIGTSGVIVVSKLGLLLC
jgi:hypothetical protein